MEYVQNMHELLMEYVWMCMEYVSNIDGIFLDKYGIFMECIKLMHCICMEHVQDMHGLCIQYVGGIGHGARPGRCLQDSRPPRT